MEEWEILYWITNSGTIDLRSLPKGIYLFRLTDKSGKTFQQKVVLNWGASR